MNYLYREKWGGLLIYIFKNTLKSVDERIAVRRYWGQGNVLGQILPFIEIEREQKDSRTLEGHLWHIIFSN